MNLNSYVHNPTEVLTLYWMPNLEWIIFIEVKYETLSIPIPILEGCLYLLDWNSGMSYGMD